MKQQIFIAVLMMVMLMSTRALAAGIEITDARATPEYWINRMSDGDRIILTKEQIESMNARILGLDRYAADLLKYPSTVTAENLRARIQKITEDVRLIGTPSVMANRNLDALSYDVETLYAVTTERVNVRLLPQPPTGDRYDEIQGTALDPAEAVAVLWQSKDGKFSFVQARYYFGWVEKSKLAFTDRQTWETYADPANFVVVTNNKKFVNVNGKMILFQMGAKIPLSTPDLQNNNSWTARIPVIENDRLSEVAVQILNDGTVSEDFLPCTSNNFIRQSFKFLGNVYGWGGLDNSVDCSSFVQDVYRSMGMNIPRDADNQEGCMPIYSVFNDVTHAERLDIVGHNPTGALLFKPGHVMMKLGNDASGTPIIIHAASSYFSGGNKIYVRKVLVSDTSYRNASNVATIDSLTGTAFAR